MQGLGVCPTPSESETNGSKISIGSQRHRIWHLTTLESERPSHPRDTYKDYEIYDVRVENLNQNSILLDSQESTDSMYVMASNDSKYRAYSYEIDRSRLIIEPGRSRTITIKFNKRYSNEAITRRIVFSDIIKNYDEYKQTQNKKEYSNRWAISIEI